MEIRREVRSVWTWDMSRVSKRDGEDLMQIADLTNDSSLKDVCSWLRPAWQSRVSHDRSLLNPIQAWRVSGVNIKVVYQQRLETR